MDKSLKTVYFYGILRTLIGRDSVQLSGSSVVELIEGVSANFRKLLQPTPDRPRIAVRIRDYDTEEEVRGQLKSDEIHVYPTMIGGGGNNGGLFKIVVGAVLIVVSVVLTYATGGLAGPLAAGLAKFGSLLLTTGAGLIVGGLMEYLAPQPKLDLNASNDIESSKYLGATGNTVKIGTPIALLMGRHKFYGHIISFNVDSKNVAA